MSKELFIVLYLIFISAFMMWSHIYFYFRYMFYLDYKSCFAFQINYLGLFGIVEHHILEIYRAQIQDEGKIELGIYKHHLDCLAFYLKEMKKLRTFVKYFGWLCVLYEKMYKTLGVDAKEYNKKVLNKAEELIEKCERILNV